MCKLQNIQTKLKAPKNQKNKFGGYNYRSCEDILEAVKPILNEENASLIINDEIVLIGDRYYVKATATLYNENNDIVGTSTAYARESETKKGMDEAQITGATSSYARKYALNGLFAIDDTKDADATNTHGKEEKQISKPINKITDDDKMLIDSLLESETMEQLKENWTMYRKVMSNDFARKELDKAKNERKEELNNG